MPHDRHRGQHRAPAGRHRAPTRAPTRVDPSVDPRRRFTRPGFLLPAAAAATLVLAATGAHLGGSTGSVSAVREVGAGPIGPAGENVSASVVSTIAIVDPIERVDQDRVARGSDRGSTATDAAVTTQVEADAEARAAKAAADARAATTGWVAPVGPGSQLTSGFGMRWGVMHPGQDFAVPVGTPVRAMSSGTVTFAGWSGGYGNKVEIQYWDGTVSWFAHNSQLLVAQGEQVTPGETVSLSGNTGHSTGAHLHLEIHPGNGTPVPPIGWLTAKGILP
ncbi:MAG: M23 family metallopeptidase [Actinomycetota bacterium]|nr:M23 family metallopeptidase [Actinomycetota bacterium]